MKILIILSALFFSPWVHAYLDPGTGSMLLQVVLGGIAAIGVALKLFWYRIAAFLGFSRKSTAEDEPD